MAQEYTVKSWKVWENEDGIIRDQHGNYKGSVLFEEESGEQIDATFKEQPNVGDKKYGDIVEYTTKAGKPRQKFQRANRLEEGANVGTAATTKGSYQPRDDASIKAQFAIKGAIQLEIGSNGDYSLSHIEETAKQLFSMIDRVKGGSESPNPKASGYEAFVAQGKRLNDMDLLDLYDDTTIRDDFLKYDS